MPPPTVVTPEFEAIVTAVKDYLELATNPPKVYFRQRGKHFWDDIENSQTISSQLNVWEITPENWTTAIPFEGGGTGNIPLRERSYSVLLTGRLAFRDGTDSDNSSMQFHTLLEYVENKILTDPFLIGPTGSTHKVIKPVTKVVVSVNDFIMYGSVLVHYAEMRFQAMIRKSGA